MCQCADNMTFFQLLHKHQQCAHTPEHSPGFFLFCVSSGLKLTSETCTYSHFLDWKTSVHGLSVWHPCLDLGMLSQLSQTLCSGQMLVASYTSSTWQSLVNEPPTHIACREDNKNTQKNYCTSFSFHLTSGLALLWSESMIERDVIGFTYTRLISNYKSTRSQSPWNSEPYHKRLKLSDDWWDSLLQTMAFRVADYVYHYEINY